MEERLDCPDPSSSVDPPQSLSVASGVCLGKHSEKLQNFKEKQQS